MEPTITQIEEELAQLVPSALPVSLLDQLDDAMSLTADKATSAPLVTVNPELSNLEESLKGLIPHGVPEDMIQRLDRAMLRWHEEVPVEEKVVPITPAVEEVSKSSWFGIRSVAAVAVLGAGSAFLMSRPPVATPDTVVEVPRTPVLTNGMTSTPVAFTPDDAKASVVAANDHGVFWTREGRPVRCVEVRVNREVSFVNERGEKLTIEDPKTEVRFLPVEFD